MRKFFNIFIILLLSSSLQSASIEKMIGIVDKDNHKRFLQVYSSNSDKIIDAETAISGGSCKCLASIINAKRQIKKTIDDYTNDSNNALDTLIKQLQKNYKEMRNRTNNIENETYFADLKAKISILYNTKNLKKHKLLGYENMLFFSKNGIFEKEDKLKNIIQLIKSLESVKNSLLIKKGEQRWFHQRK